MTPDSGHFEPQVVAFAGAFAHASKNGKPAVLHGHVVDQLENQNGFAYAGSAEKADLAAFHVGLHQVDDFDTGLEHFQAGGLIFQRRRGAMNRIVRGTVDGAKLVDGLAENVHHPAQSGAADRNGDALAHIFRGHAAHHAFDGFHGHRAHAAFAEMLLHFGGDVQRLGNVEAFAGDVHRVVNGREVAGFKLNIENRADDLHDSSDAFTFFGHAFS